MIVRKRDRSFSKDVPADELYLHHTWQSMMKRCKSHRNYAGRGISVCPEWRNKATFIRDILSILGHKPNSLHSLDRINNNGDYSPGNVRWSTFIEQGNNRRCNRILVIDGVSATVAQWGRKVGLHRNIIYNRLRAGWDAKKAVYKPLGPRGPERPMIEFNGIVKCLSHWAKEHGLRQATLHSRIKRGWEAGKAILTPGRTPLAA